MSKRKRDGKSPSKDERRRLAAMHVADMDERFGEDAERSIASCERFPDGALANGMDAVARFDGTEVEIVAIDSVGAVMSEGARDAGKRKALLDFASYRSPGGGYANGAWYAQEEMVCGESNLFNVLREMVPSFYDRHESSMRDGLYTSDSLYVPDVVFERDGSIERCDVIVMAAPNAKRAREAGVDEDEISEALSNRIGCAMSAAVAGGADVAIMGAFGCGVFGNDPKEAAGIFKRWIDEHPGLLERVVFAIPKGRGGNLEAFRSAFAIEGR